MQNVTIYDNGAGFGVLVDGLMVAHFRVLGEAWKHIEWMYEVSGAEFTVGVGEVPIVDWIHRMKSRGMLE